MTHDYKRHGTTTLFAALDVASREVIHECMPRHRHQDFLRFLMKVEKATDRNLELHFILENYAAHKHPKVKAWLEKHPRVHFHFVPTSASWAQTWSSGSARKTEREIRRLAVSSVAELESRHPELSRPAQPRPQVICVDCLGRNAY